ncbi:hypothetical protein MTO98_25610 [Mucilaginibacter sp. SMC90]|uniref:hypothetical protein n=1 Tax=Mucilaginibacter sp. SMC90 TaxID=2929803 RepID=UPI001FB228A2|nr:hypothetical protein [Mucilaginibacter sp. SMC90]UOE47791.1 hypothetical protein MTO98_25610 [Mucilaginibacter sp. SMC90]
MISRIYKLLMVCAVIAIVTISCKKGDQTYHDALKQSFTSYDGSAMDYLKAQTGVYDSLLVLVDRIPGLQDSLTNKKITFFSITNKSFETAIKSLNRDRAFENKPPLYLRDLDVSVLDTMVYKYVISGTYLTTDISSQSNGVDFSGLKYEYPMHVDYQLLNASGYVGAGEQQLLFSDTNNSTISSNWVSTTTQTLNIKTKNGIIHVLSPGHIFGFNQFSSKFNQ